MVRTYKKKKKQYNEVTIAVAINEVMAGSSIKRTAKKYGMSSGMLWNRVQMKKSNTEHKDNRVSDMKWYEVRHHFGVKTY